MAEIYIKGKTNGSLVSVDGAGTLIERLPQSFNAAGVFGLKRLEIVDSPDPDTFTLHIPDARGDA